MSALSLLMMSVGPLAQSATPAYTLDTKSHTITIHMNNDVTTEINSAVAYLITRPDKSTKWTLKFDGGRYMLNSHIYADNLQNVAFVSERTSPAILVKAPGYKSEYILYSRFSKNISVSGFQFIGRTKTYDPAMDGNLAHPSWSDQGVYFASANNILVDKNRFNDFGNAALRITTSEQDPVKGINSFNSTVTNNYFQNVFQVTTTSNSLTNGATANYLFDNNNVVDLHGSVKFATRTPGAANVWIRNNSITGSSTDGFEIASYVNLEMSYNRITNITRHAINCYTNLMATPGFQWGDNIKFQGNIIDGALNGLRFDPEAYRDGTRPVPRNVQILNNTFANLRGSSPAISIVNGTMNGLTIQGNKLNKIASKKYIGLAPGSVNVKITGNTTDSIAYTAMNQ